MAITPAGIPTPHALVADGLSLESGYFFVMPDVDIRPLAELFRAYVLKMSHGKNKSNFQVFSPLEFIAAITQHIPEMSFRLVRYYGWYSNRMRGDRKKQEKREKSEEKRQSPETFSIIDIRKYKPRRIPQLMWRECIKKVWEEEPLICPKGRVCSKSGKIWWERLYSAVILKDCLTSG